MKNDLAIDPDIKKAETLPASFYKDASIFEAIKEHIFMSSWQFIGDRKQVEDKKSIYPFVLLEEYLDEPLVLTKDEQGALHCLSNVCTHRANLVALQPRLGNRLVCKYHGRKFGLNGKFEFMPEFQEAKDFPKPCDNLRSFPLSTWGPLLFVGLNPKFEFEKVIDIMKERIGFMPLTEFVYEASLSKEYIVNSHWALYCDNYLEGFHIPFVHEELNKVIDYGNYQSEIYDYCNLQIGYADKETECFELPKDHIDQGKNIAAYYYWVFPNMMFNFYPWGLSLNIVKPIGPEKTRVSFLSYVFDKEKLGKGAGTGLDTVELEDEEVVENVQKGIKSAFYNRGRFSPKMEKGVHHFHLLLSKFLSQDQNS